MDTSILKDIGLTNAEIKVYISLLELGPSTAGPILKLSGLQNSVVHMTLGKLVGKGLISFVKKGKIRQYHATDPHNILRFIDEKRERFEEILPELQKRQKKVARQEAEVFEGYKGLKNMLNEFIKDAEKGDEYLFFSFFTQQPDDLDYVYTYYRTFEEKREELGIVVKGMAPTSIREKFKGRNTRDILFIDVPMPLNVSIFNDKIIFTPWEDEKVSFLIHSRQLAESFRKYFYSIWDKYKKK